MTPWLDGVRASLASSLVGAYLQGSLDMDAGDEHRDVEFIAVTLDALSPADDSFLQMLHGRMFVLDHQWHSSGFRANTWAVI